MLQLQMTQQREDHARAIREATARHSAESAALQSQLVCACPRLPFLSTQQTTSSQETTRTELQRARTEAARAREEGAAAQAELSTLRQSTERLTAELAQTKETLRTAEARLHAVEPLDVHSDAFLAAWDVPLDPATADPTAVKRTEPLRAQCVAYQQLIAAVAASAPVVAPSEVQEAPKQQQEEEQKVVPQTHTQAQTQTRHWDDAAEAALLEACRVHGVAVSEVCPLVFSSSSSLFSSNASKQDIKTTGVAAEHLHALRAQYAGAVAQAVRAARAADERARAVQQGAAAAREQAAQERARAADAARALAEARDDLAGARTHYEGQLEALTEYAAAVKDQVAALDVRLTDVHACEVQCATCRGWNSVQYLLSPDGAGGKVCSHGNHPTCTFKR